VLYRKGKYDEALETLEKAAKLQPEEAIIYEHMGDVFVKKEESEKAVASYKKALGFTKKDKESAKKIESKIADLDKNKKRGTAGDN
jgi:predicted negative regulator of RcsB-dependent stress response